MFHKLRKSKRGGEVASSSESSSAGGRPASIASPGGRRSKNPPKGPPSSSSTKPPSSSSRSVSSAPYTASRSMSPSYHRSNSRRRRNNDTKKDDSTSSIMTEDASSVAASSLPGSVRSAGNPRSARLRYNNKKAPPSLSKHLHASMPMIHWNNNDSISCANQSQSSSAAPPGPPPPMTSIGARSVSLPDYGSAALEKTLDYHYIEAINKSWDLVQQQVPGDWKQQLGKQILFNMASIQSNTCDLLGLESPLRPPAKVFSVARNLAKMLQELMVILAPTIERDDMALELVQNFEQKRGFDMSLFPAYCQAVPKSCQRLLHGDWNDEMSEAWKEFMELAAAVLCNVGQCRGGKNTTMTI